jgi:hypothetical protein
MKQFYNRLNSGILRALQQAKRIHGGGGHLVFRTLLLALLLLSTPSLRVALRAQSRTMALSGIVLDENDAPMVGVSVVAAKSTIGTTTDTRGTFRLVVNTQCD